VAARLNAALLTRTVAGYRPGSRVSAQAARPEPGALTARRLAIAALTVFAAATHIDLVYAAGSHAWTQSRVSTGLHSLQQVATVSYQPTPSLVPPGSVITHAYAHRDYAGQADVHTSLCWNGTERCIDITGRSINTHAFNGLDAGQPMLLVHRVTAWRGSKPPLFIKGSVNVSYGPPGQP